MLSHTRCFLLLELAMKGKSGAEMIEGQAIVENFTVGADLVSDKRGSHLSFAWN